MISLKKNSSYRDVIVQMANTYEENDLRMLTCKRIPSSKSIVLERMNRPNGVSVDKKADLKRFCEKGLIPQQFHKFYMSLETSESVIDFVERHRE